MSRKTHGITEEANAMEQETREEMLGIVKEKIAVFEGMVKDDMKRVMERKSPEMIAIAAEDLDRHNYALSILK